MDATFSGLSAFRALHLPEGYREIGVIGEYTSELRVEENTPTASAQGGPVGYRFLSSDGKHVVQSRVNGFTFSRLAPYDRWEKFIEEAQSTWLPYRAVAGPAAVLQFSVRFINKLQLPVGEEISLYLRTFPEISRALPQLLTGSFMRVELHIPEPAGTLILQQFFTRPDVPGHVTTILDIELRFAASPAQHDEDLWHRINALRDLKNEFFRGCLTEKMEERID
jgi:uncharacterized protein (TIGR04255 family)